jgi:GntR family transcriptional regulator / MocR family aminotransferase
MHDISADHFLSHPFGIHIDRAASASLVHQVSDRLREAVRSGQLAGGFRLPSSRNLARELAVSRSVVVSAYEQLEAEGYLEGKVGSGSYVAEGAASASSESTRSASARPHARPAPSAGFGGTGEPQAGLVDFDLASGCPDPAGFPRDEWGRCLSLAARKGLEAYGYGDPAGEPALRRAVSDYLFRMKGMDCGEDEVIVTAGSSQAALIIASLLGKAQEGIQVEDPGYPPLRAAFKRLGLEPKPLGVDEQGLISDEVEPGLPLLATPAHHFPTGAVLPAERRERISAAARSGGGLVVEDDYDGELRLRGFPIRPLWSIAPDRVLFLGSFSKVMYPGIRLGYLVARAPLAERILRVKRGLALGSDSIAQRALARFVDEGRLDRRVRALKRECGARRALIEELAAKLPGGPPRVLGEECGMHLRLAFPEGLPASFAPKATRAAGFVAPPLSSFASRRSTGYEDSILIGYGNIDEASLREGFKRIGTYIESRGV